MPPCKELDETKVYTSDDIEELAERIDPDLVTILKSGQLDWVISALDVQALHCEDDSNTPHLAYICAVDYLRRQYSLPPPPDLPEFRLVRAIRRRLAPGARRRTGDERCGKCATPRKRGGLGKYDWLGCFTGGGRKRCARCIVSTAGKCRLPDSEEIVAIDESDEEKSDASAGAKASDGSADEKMAEDTTDSTPGASAADKTTKTAAVDETVYAPASQTAANNSMAKAILGIAAAKMRDLTTDDIPDMAAKIESTHIGLGDNGQYCWIQDAFVDEALRCRDIMNTPHLVYMCAVNKLRLDFDLDRPPALPYENVLNAIKRRLHPTARKREGSARCGACVKSSPLLHGWLECWSKGGQRCSLCCTKNGPCVFPEDQSGAMTRDIGVQTDMNEDVPIEVDVEMGEANVPTRESTLATTSTTGSEEPEPSHAQPTTLGIVPDEPTAPVSQPTSDIIAAILADQLVTTWDQFYGSLLQSIDHETPMPSLLDDAAAFKKVAEGVTQACHIIDEGLAGYLAVHWDRVGEYLVDIIEAKSPALALRLLHNATVVQDTVLKISAAYGSAAKSELMTGIEGSAFPVGGSGVQSVDRLV